MCEGEDRVIRKLTMYMLSVISNSG